ncbi:DoxX family protein [Mycobacterium sp. 852002-51057_SCH5723018]|uniref:DoxX family protein n=1 Tax=Mycobacterium sp. 852002-51057_SCH5723018 TaxID=1834094 RepID=UPI0009EF248D|nr:DoxX family protein [Mycobacterium sp. 852002-51057_SCH5723018]
MPAGYWGFLPPSSSNDRALIEAPAADRPPGWSTPDAHVPRSRRAHTASIPAPLAAIGLLLVLIGAMSTHARRREYTNVALNVLLALVAGATAWERLGPYPF